MMQLTRFAPWRSCVAKFNSAPASFLAISSFFSTKESAQLKLNPNVYLNDEDRAWLKKLPILSKTMHGKQKLKLIFQEVLQNNAELKQEAKQTQIAEHIVSTMEHAAETSLPYVDFDERLFYCPWVLVILEKFHFRFQIETGRQESCFRVYIDNPDILS